MQIRDFIFFCYLLFFIQVCLCVSPIAIGRKTLKAASLLRSIYHHNYSLTLSEQIKNNQYENVKFINLTLLLLIKASFSNDKSTLSDVGSRTICLSILSVRQIFQILLCIVSYHNAFR